MPADFACTGGSAVANVIMADFRQTRGERVRAKRTPHSTEPARPRAGSVLWGVISGSSGLRGGLGWPESRLARQSPDIQLF